MKYFSFLIVQHPDHAALYLSGFPIGIIRDGVFTVHQVVTPSGNRRDITMHDLGNLVVGGCPFATIDELRAHVSAAVQTMQVAKS